MVVAGAVVVVVVGASATAVVVLVEVAAARFDGVVLEHDAATAAAATSATSRIRIRRTVRPVILAEDAGIVAGDDDGPVPVTYRRGCEGDRWRCAPSGALAEGASLRCRLHARRRPRRGIDPRPVRAPARLRGLPPSQRPRRHPRA